MAKIHFFWIEKVLDEDDDMFPDSDFDEDDKKELQEIMKNVNEE